MKMIQTVMTTRDPDSYYFQERLRMKGGRICQVFATPVKSATGREEVEYLFILEHPEEPGDEVLSASG
jgi:hypothetical protein